MIGEVSVDQNQLLDSVFTPRLLWLSGTYRCDVKDVSFRRVKREYWGIRVLPAKLFNLDYASGNSLDQWKSTGSQQEAPVDPRITLLVVVGVTWCRWTDWPAFISTSSDSLCEHAGPGWADSGWARSRTGAVVSLQEIQDRNLWLLRSSASVRVL